MEFPVRWVSQKASSIRNIPFHCSLCKNECVCINKDEDQRWKCRDYSVSSMLTIHLCGGWCPQYCHPSIEAILICCIYVGHCSAQSLTNAAWRPFGGSHEVNISTLSSEVNIFSCTVGFTGQLTSSGYERGDSLCRTCSSVRAAPHGHRLCLQWNEKYVGNPWLFMDRSTHVLGHCTVMA